jgi:hypothetical protein
MAQPRHTAPNLVQLSFKERLQQRLLDHTDLQQLFKVSRGTIYNWRRRGILKFIEIGGRKYFDANDIDALLEKYKQTQVPGEQRRESRD